ncbi:MAG: hypothetical protein WBO34_10070 [Gammaproteobacteria bacterium]
MPVDKLILLPDDALVGIDDCHELAVCLQGIGLIDEQRASDSGLFYPAGAQFLQLVSFLGCSPSIELEPPGDGTSLEQAVVNGRFCHVVLACEPTLRFRADPQTRPPRCPQCGAPEPDWQARIRRWQDKPAKSHWSCAACGHRGNLTDWVFRKTAGFGKVFVEIRGIYPAEAVPGAALLAALSAYTGGAWHYIYIKE